MLKKILLKIQKLEQQKQIKVNKQAEIQKEIDDLDAKLKKLYSFKKDYEKLESNSTDFLNSIGGKAVWIKKMRNYLNYIYNILKKEGLSFS